LQGTKNFVRKIQGREVGNKEKINLQSTQMSKGSSFLFEIEGSRDRESPLYLIFDFYDFAMVHNKIRNQESSFFCD